RGYRIEPGEVEAALLGDPTVAAAAVVPGCGAPGGDVDGPPDQLVAFVVPAPGAVVDAAALREGVKRNLPAYMVPARVIPVAAIPATPAAKAERRALPSMEPGPVTNHESHEPPATPLAAPVAAIWQELLGVPTISMDNNFYALGGHSMPALRAVARLEKATGV